MPKQSSFIWKGLNTQGEILKGVIIGESIASLQHHFKQKGIIVKTIRKQHRWFSSFSSKIQSTSIAFFTQQLASMLNTGIGIVPALEILIRSQTNTRMHVLLLSIKYSLESGHNLAESLERYPLFFNKVYCNLISIGEKSGSLVFVLQHLGAYIEKMTIFQKKLKKSLRYPLLISFLALIVILILLLLVIPQFVTLFASFQAQLPAYTRWVLKLAEYLQKYGLFFIVFCSTFFYGLVQATQSPRLAYKKDYLKLHLPISGKVARSIANARFTRALSILLQAAVPLREALYLVAESSGNKVYTKAILAIHNDLAEGISLQLATTKRGLFPNLLQQLITTGENTAKLDVLLAQAAVYYENEVDSYLEAISSLLEPIIMAILGVLVGGLIIAMYLPVFQLGLVI